LRRHFGWAYRLDRVLVVTLALAVGGIWLFAGVTQDVTDKDGVTTADPRILHDVIGYRGSLLTPLAKIVTTLGTGPVVYPAVLICGVLASRTRHRWWPVCFAVGVLLSGQMIRLVINRAVARPRPPHELWLVHAGGYAFPSGHTTTAVLGYVVAAALLARRWPNVRVAFFSVAAVCALAVGLSRVYLGVHWPSDVLGGWLLAGTWLALCALGYRTVSLQTRRRVERRRPPLSATP
jgi:undecaprenyl-diphosphatase